MRLVGRERELGRILRLLDRLEEGRGDCVIAVGVAGVGKTRLLEEAAALAGMVAIAPRSAAHPSRARNFHTMPG